MFQVYETRVSRGFQLAIGGLAILSLTGLIVTLWILADFQHEQEIVARIIRDLPDSDLAVARELAVELRFQSQLSILLVLNILATAVALALLVRAYLNSERSLREVKVMASDVLASMDQGVLTTDRDEVITSINPRGIELLGLQGQVVDQPLSVVGIEHTLLSVICSHVNAHHSPVRDCDYTITTQGHEQTLRAGCSLLRNEQQAELGTVIHVRDVTERVLMEQRLRRMERYAGLGSLATGLQHEIKNPLSALSLHVQLLDEALVSQATGEEVDEMLGVIHTEIKRLTSVLEGFRDYASMSEPGRSDVDLAASIKKLARFIRPQAEQQRVKVEVNLAEESLPTIKADPVHMDQVLLNLALNALQAMPDGGTLSIGLQKEGEWLRIKVADTGRGIPVEYRDRIFDPYFTTRNEGTGMGLALCEKIVRQHDGTIDLETGAEGTTFSVILPIDEKP
ncbi:ATP-binding protein [Gimesia sp.]|uniref:two-component system sensor histidine kinase NtrB n=1 Tax=Gimesia sp. TaxID=2024833 RepID=UPI000C54C08D|nr:ATP-binding protein [Gimesia sp.]MAX35183.1 PAS domain-containing sensor histidine kinase [Gimesia sp.]HBL43603.1 PAS domain-containing sensor histidine kinase [Planctomycetaceae bacterium]|tara:strand:+ start:1280 stop:2638 length:1359 start_codon:yes stop_codon:yes gene_type:complete